MAKTPKIIPVSDLRKKTSAILKELSSGNPVFVTQRGRPSAVMISMKSYERSQHELDILQLLARGEKEIEAGKGYEFQDVLTEADEFLKAAES
jgi:prevent-host-death family protein